MKRVAVLIALLLSVAATGCASASAPTRANDTALTQRSQPIYRVQTVVVNCSFKQQTRPSNFILTCADAGDVLAHLHWASWGLSAAFATGTEQVNDCTPNCAAGWWPCGMPRPTLRVSTSMSSIPSATANASPPTAGHLPS